MSVRIRLSRIGKKKAPFYRIVAVDKRGKRDGKYLENLGTYNPLTSEIVQFHAEKLASWLEKGAIPSDTVVKIQKQYARAQAAPKKAKAESKQVEKKVAPKKVEAAATQEAPKADKAVEKKADDKA